MKLQKNTPCTREMKIGDTVYIVEAVASENATESAYDKVKRLIMGHVGDFEKLSEQTQKSA